MAWVSIGCCEVYTNLGEKRKTFIIIGYKKCYITIFRFKRKLKAALSFPEMTLKGVWDNLNNAVILTYLNMSVHRKTLTKGLGSHRLSNFPTHH